MAIVTWNSTSSSNWDVAASWSPGLPTSIDTALISLAGSYDITIATGESVSVANVTQLAGELTIAGGLTLNDPDAVLAIGPGATLDHVSATGNFAVFDSGTLFNQGTVGSSVSGDNFSIYAAAFGGPGELAVSDGAGIGISSDDFSNISDGTLTEGNYVVTAGSASGVYTSLTFFPSTAKKFVADAATITLSGSLAMFWQYSSAAGFEPLEAALTTIASTGVLNVVGGRDYAATTALTDGGLLTLGGGTLSAIGLTVTGSGTLAGFGTISTMVADAGLVEAQGGTLDLAGGIDGKGLLEIDPNAALIVGGILQNSLMNNGTVIVGGDLLDVLGSVSGPGGFVVGGGSAIGAGVPTLDLQNTSAAGIDFGGRAVVSLDLPSGFTGSISNFGVGDTIDLAGIVANGATLAGDTLEVTENGATVYSLAMSGTAAGLTFAANPDATDGTALTATGAPGGFIINLVPDASVASAPAGFTAAMEAGAKILEDTFTNDITLNIRYGWGTFNNVPNSELTGDASIAAIGAPVNNTDESYSVLKSWLAANANTPADQEAVASLPADNSSFPDSANSFYVSSSQEKALGQIAGDGTAIDGAIGFSTEDGNFTDPGFWNYAIFVELTHAMARLTEYYAGAPTIMDLYRYSAPGVFEWTAGQPAYFSIDGGQTPLAQYSTSFDYTLWTGQTGDPLNVSPYQVDALSSVDVTQMDVLGFDSAAPCFASGTRISTARGEVAVEELRLGDRVEVVHRNGFAPIVWIGRRRVDCRRHSNPRDVWPVHVRAGAFGAGIPRCDLWLSPDHAVYIGSVLIPIRYLINGATVVQGAADVVTYWHVELARHEVIVAEGLPCESYLDTGNRCAFDNGAQASRAARMATPVINGPVMVGK